jgi:hypothetical protein
VAVITIATVASHASLADGASAIRGAIRQLFIDEYMAVRWWSA